MSYVDRPGWQAVFDVVNGLGRLRSYVRPFGAAHLAAGPDEVRRPGPDHCGELCAHEYLDKAIRLSPYDRAVPYWYGAEAQASFGLKRYDQAIEQFRKVIAINPNDIPWAHTMLVAALALTHQDAEAREALRATSRCPPAGRLRQSRHGRRTTSPSTGYRLK